MRYVLHADENESVHIGVVKKAGVDPETVVGGGNIGWSSSGIRLRGSSEHFKAEPADLRAIFDGLVNERLKDQIERFKAERLAAKG